MKKKLPITKNKDVVVSWVYTWSKQQDMSIHEQRIVLRILEACQAELKGGKKKNDREKEQSKTNQRAVGLGTVFYGVYTNVYKRFVFY